MRLVELPRRFPCSGDHVVDSIGDNFSSRGLAPTEDKALQRQPSVCQNRAMPESPPNLLEDSGLPIAYAVRPGGEVPDVPDLEDFTSSARTVVRSLTVMQKEAIVATSGSPIAWRLSSDEGPYLAGHDFAPAPLAIMTSGFAADLMVRVAAAMEAADLPTGGLELTLDTHFNIEGSMLRGTMVAGADNPEIGVSSPVADRTASMNAALTGINASATAGLIGPSLDGLFTLTSHGRRIPAGRVHEAEQSSPVDPGGYRQSPPADESRVVEPLVTKVVDVEAKPSDAGVGLQASQKRSLHLQASGKWREDGVKSIEVDVIRPTGSTFRILSDEPPGEGGQGRAPDALALISAGLGFCFMTQIGRFAKIAKHSLGEYHILQDTRFAVGDPRADPPIGGRAAPPVTHCYLEPDGDDDFARQALSMSEQTCFLHALCRTELRPKVRVGQTGAPAP